MPATGKFDFFKLLVWDMVLEKVLDQVDRAASDALLSSSSLWMTERASA